MCLCQRNELRHARLRITVKATLSTRIGFGFDTNYFEAI